MSAATHPSLPLDGITVVALEQAVAAPIATRHLADLGATSVVFQPTEDEPDLEGLVNFLCTEVKPLLGV